MENIVKNVRLLGEKLGLPETVIVALTTDAAIEDFKPILEQADSSLVAKFSKDPRVTDNPRKHGLGEANRKNTTLLKSKFGLTDEEIKDPENPAETVSFDKAMEIAYAKAMASQGELGDTKTKLADLLREKEAALSQVNNYKTEISKLQQQNVINRELYAALAELKNELSDGYTMDDIQNYLDGALPKKYRFSPLEAGGVTVFETDGREALTSGTDPKPHTVLTAIRSILPKGMLGGKPTTGGVATPAGEKGKSTDNERKVESRAAKLAEKHLAEMKNRK